MTAWLLPQAAVDGFQRLGARAQLGHRQRVERTRVDPSVLTTQFIPVDVETGGELSVGRTVCDFRFRGGKPANVSFAMDADEPKFVRMLKEILGRTA